MEKNQKSFATNDESVSTLLSLSHDRSDDSFVERSPYNKKQITFQYVIEKETFSNLTHFVQYANTHQRGNLKMNYLKFRPGIWEPFLIGYCTKTQKLPCAFKYKHLHLTIDGSSGKFEGAFYLLTIYYLQNIPK